MARVPGQAGAAIAARLQTAWQRHPLVSVLRLRRRLVFCRNLLSVVKAGLPISTVFSPTWRGATGNPALARAGERLRGGASLAEALEEIQELIDPVTRALLAAGEQSGRLQQILERRISELEEHRDFVFYICKLALYPLYLLGTLIFVGPLLSLPGAASAGTCPGSLGQVYLANLLGMLLQVTGGIAMLLSLPLLVALLGIEQAMSRMLLRSPLLGPLLRDAYGARLCVGLSAAVGGGLEVVRAVRLAGQATASPYVESRVPAAVGRLAEGGALTDAVAALGVLEVESLGQVAIAERTGELEASLNLLGRELRAAVSRRARVVVILLTILIAASALATAVVKMLGVIFGTIRPSLELPLDLGIR
jgi:general secretion pathway protein F